MTYVGDFGARYYSAGEAALTPREFEVVGALCAGEYQSEVAARLCISIKTVEGHVAHAKRRFGVRTLVQLAYVLGQRTGGYEIDPEIVAWMEQGDEILTRRRR